MKGLRLTRVDVYEDTKGKWLWEARAGDTVVALSYLNEGTPEEALETVHALFGEGFEIVYSTPDDQESQTQSVETTASQSLHSPVA